MRGIRPAAFQESFQDPAVTRLGFRRDVEVHKRVKTKVNGVRPLGQAGELARVQQVQVDGMDPLPQTRMDVGRLQLSLKKPVPVLMRVQQERGWIVQSGQAVFTLLHAQRSEEHTSE